MFSFGKDPIRLIESFGVAGLLSKDSTVFYDNLFTTRHVGRIGDLLCARLQSVGLDDMRVRAIVLFTVYEAYRSQQTAVKAFRFFGKNDKNTLDNPIIVECGLDHDQVALGVSFVLNEGAVVETDGLAARVFNRETKGPFEALLGELYPHSDRMLLRYHPPTRRVEVISLLGIPGKIDEEALKQKQLLHVVVLEEDQIRETPRAKVYVELGDLNYGKLLRGDERPPELLTGAIVEDADTKVGGWLSRRKTKTNIEGGQEDGDDVQRFSGDAGEDEDDIVRVKGSKKRALFTKVDDVIRIKGDGPQSQSGDSYGVSGGGSEFSGGTLQNGAAKIKKFFKKIWPFKKKSDVVLDGEDRGEGESGVTVIRGSDYDDSGMEKDLELKAGASGSSATGDLGAADESSDDDADEEAANLSPEALAAAADANPEGDSRRLVTELGVGKLDRALKKAQEEAKEMRKEFGSARSKRWVDNLMGELLAEKGRLLEMTKSVNLSVRQKELAFKNRQQALQEELRRKEEELTKRNNALIRNREQLNVVTRTMERLRAQSADAADDAHFKQKYNLTQRMLTLAKDDNAQLTRRVDELKNQLSSAQMGAKNRGASYKEYADLQSKYERLHRQTDEMKKLNRQLMEHVNDKKDRGMGVAGGSEDLKRRLEAAMKLATVSKKESDTMKSRVMSMQKEEVKLRIEINRLQAELRKTGGGGEGTGSGTPPAEGGASTPPKAA